MGYLWDLSLSNTVEKMEVPSAIILQIKIRSFGRSFMYMRNRHGPKTEPCGTPEGIIFQYEHWPSSISKFWAIKVVF